MRDLKHPNIVAYKDSFIDEGLLIIIMEYCEEGDLAFHVKRKLQKKEYFPEKLILNWFLQVALALSYVHEKKILHRDVKTSNIFLTSNGTVKLGDFGISKLLENTSDAACTVVGTPYYMRFKLKKFLFEFYFVFLVPKSVKINLILINQIIGLWVAFFMSYAL